MHKKIQRSQTKDQIDERVMEFMKQNRHVQHKSARKKMAKILFQVPHSQLSLLPFYARFTASLFRYFK